VAAFCIGAAFLANVIFIKAQPVAPINRVLELDGNGSYVKLPDGIFNGLTNATVEARVLWRTARGYQRFFSFGEFEHDMGAGQEPLGSLYYFSALGSEGRTARIYANGLLSANRWYHVAAVSGAGGMKLYLNGVLVGSNGATSSLAATSGQQNLLGAWNGGPENKVDPQTFNGLIDEMRVWRVARTQAEIRDDMGRNLASGEPGLVGLWNFDNSTVKDASTNHHDGTLVGQARVVESPSSIQEMMTNPPTLISGTVRDRSGSSVAGAEVVLQQNGQPIVRAATDGSGAYQMVLIANGPAYDMIAASGHQSAWQTLSMLAGEPVRADFVVQPNSVEGKVMSLGFTVMPSVEVEALWYGTNATRAAISTTSRTNEPDSLRPGLVGEYFDLGVPLSGFPSVAGLEPSLRRVDSRVYFPAMDAFSTAGFKIHFYVRWLGKLRITRPGKHTLYLQADDGGRVYLDDHLVLDNEMQWSTETSGGVDLTAGDHEVRIEYLQQAGGANCIFSWAGPDLRKEVVPATALFHPYLRGTDMTLVPLDSSPASALSTNTVLTDKEGAFRFLNLRPGWYHVRVHDTKRYHYVAEDAGKVFAVEPGQPVKGIEFCLAPFRKGTWRHYTYLQGLADDRVFCSHVAPDGMIWFGTADGVSRFDGREFKNLTREDGLSNSRIYAIASDAQGSLWFGTERGISCRAADKFVPVRLPVELATETVRAIHCDESGALWFGTDRHGVYRFDPRQPTARFAHFTIGSGSPAEWIVSLARGPDGSVWAGTSAGAYRFTGTAFVNTLPPDLVGTGSEFNALATGSAGRVWLGAGQKGLLFCEGGSWHNLNQGVIPDLVISLACYPDGTCWFGGSGQRLLRFDGQTIVHFTEPEGSALGGITCIQRDRRGVLWVTTSNEGVWRYDDRTFISFGPADGLPGSSMDTAFSAPDGTVWFGGDGGVTRFDGTNFINLTRGLMGPRVTAIARARDGMMWFGTLGRSDRGNLFNGTNFFTPAVEGWPLTDWIRKVAPAPDGSVWFSCGEQVFHYDGHRLDRFDRSKFSITYAINEILCDDRGTVWIGTASETGRQHGSVPLMA